MKKAMKSKEIASRITGFSTPVFGVQWNPPAACRWFVDTVQDGPPRIQYYDWTETAQLNTALGELRGVIGMHVAAIAVSYGLDVEADLASIIPAADDDDGSLSILPRRKKPTRHP